MIFRCHSKTDEVICLKFYPCKNLGENITFEEWHHKKPLTIYLSDYRQLLLKYLTAIYPIKDPTNGKTIEAFDECFDNWIGKDDWTKLLQIIQVDLGKKNNSTTKPENEFYLNFIDWIEKETEWADIIVVEGNL